MLAHPSPSSERHEVIGDAVVRGVRAALDSLRRDMPSTGRVVAIGELREVLRLLGESPDGAGPGRV